MQHGGFRTLGTTPRTTFCGWYTRSLEVQEITRSSLEIANDLGPLGPAARLLEKQLFVQTSRTGDTRYLTFEARHLWQRLVVKEGIERNRLPTNLPVYFSTNSEAPVMV